MSRARSATPGSSAKARNTCGPDISSTPPAGWSRRRSIGRTARSISRRCRSSSRSRPRDSEGRISRLRPSAGTLVDLPAGLSVGSRTLLRVDRDGRASPLIGAPAAYESPAFSPMAASSRSRSTRAAAATSGSSISPSDAYSIHRRRHQRVSRVGSGRLENPSSTLPGPGTCLKAT